MKCGAALAAKSVKKSAGKLRVHFHVDAALEMRHSSEMALSRS